MPPSFLLISIMALATPGRQRTPLARLWILMRKAAILFYKGISQGQPVFRSSRWAAEPPLCLRAKLPYGEGDSTGNTTNGDRQPR